MKNRLFTFSIGIVLTIICYSCQKEINSNKVGETTLSASTSTSLNAVAEECGIFRTQTPGGWGTEPSGNNPGAYLHANFAAAFPDDLQLWLLHGDFYVSFTSAQAITDYMPAGGKPQPLTNSYTDPTTSDLKNTLVSQVIALMLSTGFDNYDPNFGPSDLNLGFMVIASGAMQGLAVNEVLAEANMVLGGCSGNYSVSNLVNTLIK